MDDAICDLACRVMDALDMGIVVVDKDFRIVYANLAARAMLGESASIEDDALRALLTSESPPPSGESRLLSWASPWVNGTGVHLFVRCKRLDPDGLVVTFNRDRLRERDLVGMMRVQFGLNVRQQQIVLLLRNGLSNRKIAERLGISEATVKTYLTVVFQAFEVTNRTSLLAKIERLRPER